MSPTLTPPRLETTEAAVTVEVSEEDLMRLQALATAAGVGEPNARSFADLLSSTLRRGILESYRAAELGWSLDPIDADIGGEDPSDKPVGDGSVGRKRTQILRASALLAAAATIVLLIGSYADHWTWTGFTKNGQVWDWMQLLLLPVAIGTFPLWLRFSGEMSPARRKALGGAVVAFTAFVLAGYLVPLTWTGFRGHTLWNWLTLIVLPITVTTATVWPKLGRSQLPACIAVAGGLAAAWIATVIGGYADGWVWTGYPGTTLWEWVQLLLAPIAITTFVVPELIKLVAGDVADDSQE